jgi:hypothetical protein
MMKFVSVYCKEHKKREMVPEHNYHTDLMLWYRYEMHPRFSIVQMMSSLGFSYRNRRIRSILRSRESPFEEIRAALEKKKCTKADLLSVLSPLRPVPLTALGRRHTVEFRFRVKYRKESFTTEDYLQETNQERRRLMLRHGVDIKSVVAKMKLVKKTEEGELYRDYTTTPTSSYLHVTCPSTREHYLLGVPNGFTSPEAARRWTFGSDKNARFVKEA